MLTEAELQTAVSQSLPRLARLARRLAGNAELGDEALQDALLRIAKSWRLFRGESSLQTWMTTIVIRSVRDRIAKTNATRSGQLAVEPIDGRQTNPAADAIDRETDVVVRRAVRGLPARQREVFTLTVWEQMSADEIADVLQINRQAVYANLSAARKTLREKLAHYFESVSET